MAAAVLIREAASIPPQRVTIPEPGFFLLSIGVGKFWLDYRKRYDDDTEFQIRKHSGRSDASGTMEVLLPIRIGT